jgi:hypothetical protein
MAAGKKSSKQSAASKKAAPARAARSDNGSFKDVRSDGKVGQAKDSSGSSLSQSRRRDAKHGEFSTTKSEVTLRAFEKTYDRLHSRKD